MKFVLIAVNTKYSHTNPAVYSISHHLKKLVAQKQIADWEIRIIECNINQQPEEVEALLFREDADLYGFSVYIWNRTFVQRLLDYMKQVRPGAKYIAGGPEIAFDFTEEYERLPQLDYIMPGDGEAELEYLLTGVSNQTELAMRLAEAKNSSLQADSFVRRTFSPDKLPFYFPSEEDNLQHKIAYYEGSRGCPFQCAYCISCMEPHPTFKPMEQIREELTYFIEREYPLVKFLDRSFNFPSARAIEIWTFLIARYNETIAEKTHVVFPCFHFELEASLLDDESVALLIQAPKGIFQFEIGVQDIHAEVLRKVNRHPLKEQDFQRISMLLSARRQHIHLDLIAGLPGQTYSHLRDSYNYLWSFHPDMLQLGILKVLRGTPVRKIAVAEKFSFHKDPPYEIYETTTLSAKELLEIKDVAEVTDQYLNSDIINSVLEVCLLKSALLPFDFMLGLASYYMNMRGEALRYLSPEEKQICVLEYMLECFGESTLDEIFPLYRTAFDERRKKGSLPFERVVQKLEASGKISMELCNYIKGRYTNDSV